MDEKVTYLNNYIQTYLEKDVRAIETITDLPLYRHLMEVIAEQTGSVRDEKKIVDALGCSRDTLKKYRGFLAATLLYQDIYPYISNTMRRIVKSPKGYLRNNGLISTLTGINQLIPKVIQKLAFGLRQSPGVESIASHPIFLILGDLQSFNRGSFRATQMPIFDSLSV